MPENSVSNPVGELLTDLFRLICVQKIQSHLLKRLLDGLTFGLSKEQLLAAKLATVTAMGGIGK
jgi:hypothetical protein